MKYRDIELEHDQEYYEKLCKLAKKHFDDLQELEQYEVIAYNLNKSISIGYALLVANYTSHFGADAFLFNGPADQTKGYHPEQVASLAYACLKSNKHWYEYWRQWGRQLGFNV